MGGWKGILMALDDENFENNKLIYVWDSMKKFESRSETVSLDMIRFTEYMSLFLNVQSIVIMWNRGISEETFLNLRQFDSQKMWD